MNTSKQVIREKVEQYRKEQLDPIMDLAVKGLPEGEAFIQRDVYLTGLDFAINNALQNPGLKDHERVFITCQKIGIMESYAELLYERMTVKSISVGKETTVN
jgi:hypothetical protein